MGIPTRRIFGLSLLCLSSLGCPKFAEPVEPAVFTARDSWPDHSGHVFDQGGDLAADLDQSKDVDAFDQPPAVGPWTYTLWAPQAKAVTMISLDARDQPIQSWPMRALDEGGLWGTDAQLEHGERYQFSLESPEGQRLTRHDPRALALNPPDISTHYVFEDAAHVTVNPREAVLYELHPGSFSATATPATFEQARSRLAHVAQLGATTIAMMPVHEFPGELSWGYNPISLYAVERAYGGAQGLRAFVDDAHGRGLSVLADVVYNHLEQGTPLCDFDLLRAAPPCGALFYDGELGQTDWGPRPSFEHPQARALLLQHPIRWMEAFGIDGFRWDSTSNIRATKHAKGQRIEAGWSLMREANASIHQRGGFSIAEDLQGEALITSPAPEGAGFDAQWDASFEAIMARELKRAADPAAPGVDLESITQLLQALAERPFTQVIYTESHDSTGQLNGHVRLPVQLDPMTPISQVVRELTTLGAGLLLSSPAIPMLLQGQEFLSVGSFHDSQPVDWSLAVSQAQTLRRYQSLIKARRNLGGVTRGLMGQGLKITHLNEAADVFVMHRWDEGGPGDDVIVVVNLSGTDFTQYRLGVPSAGRWHQRATSAGDASDSPLEATQMTYDGLPASLELSLRPRQLMILSQDRP